MNTLYATDVRDILRRLSRVETWAANIQADSAGRHHFHALFIRDEIAEVRNTLLRASCADVAVETTDAAAPQPAEG